MSADFATYPALPFVLGTMPLSREDPRIPAILQSLESLRAIAFESSRELASLRELGQEILRAVSTVRNSSVGPELIEEPPASTGAVLRLKLLGSFAAEAEGRGVSHWPSKKARLLLAYLAMERGRMVPRDVLIDLFWPDAPPSRGSNNLSIAIHQIRSTLAEMAPGLAGCVLVKQGVCGLDDTAVTTDLWEFQQSLAHARQALENKDPDGTRLHLGSALAAYHGELLESDPYEEWAAEPRRTLNTAYYQALSWLTGRSAQSDDWPAVLEYGRLMLQREPFDEAGHRWLMRAYWKLGNRPQALRQFRLCEEALRDELGLPPSEETRALYLSIQRA